MYYTMYYTPCKQVPLYYTMEAPGCTLMYTCEPLYYTCTMETPTHVNM